MAELSRQLSIFEAPELINEDSALISFSLEKRLYFKKILTEYNTEAKEAAIGLSDMFEGNPLNREQILTPIKTSEKYEQRIDEIRTNNNRIAQAIEARGKRDERRDSAIQPDTPKSNRDGDAKVLSQTNSTDNFGRTIETQPAEGLPLAFSINPGNTNEQVTMRPLEDKLSTKFGLSKFVVCTDAGLTSLENRKYNDVGERAFITTQSLKKVAGHIKEWALSSDNWRIIGDDKVYNISELGSEIDYWDTTFYKEIWMNENGLSQRIIVTYSIKYKEFVRVKRDAQIERARMAIDLGSAKINTKKGTDYKRFVKQEYCTTDGELAQINVCSLNTDKINQEEQYDGLYAVTTNLEDKVHKIIEINKRRWEIEESFRLMKTEFKARPVYLQREDRIKAHFITCFLSLMIFRMLEKRVEYKYSCEKLIDTIANMNLYKVSGEGYIPTYTRTAITDNLHAKFNFRLDHQIISSQKMKKIISQTKK